MTAAETPRRSWVGLLIPAVLAFIVLIGLGTWQVQRKAWKEALIASLTERLAAPPSALPAPKSWDTLDAADDEYRRVQFSAQFDYAGDALVYASAAAFRPDVSGPGYWVFTPARLADGSIVIVNRGFRAGRQAGPKIAVRWANLRTGRSCRRHALAGCTALVHAERRSGA